MLHYGGKKGRCTVALRQVVAAKACYTVGPEGLLHCGSQWLAVGGRQAGREGRNHLSDHCNRFVILHEFVHKFIKRGLAANQRLLIPITFTILPLDDGLWCTS